MRTAWKCSTKKRSMCTNVGLLASKNIVFDQNADIPMTEAQCRSIITFKVWQNMELIQGGQICFFRIRR